MILTADCNFSLWEWGRKETKGLKVSLLGSVASRRPVKGQFQLSQKTQDESRDKSTLDALPEDHDSYSQVPPSASQPSVTPVLDSIPFSSLQEQCSHMALTYMHANTL